MDDHLGVWTSTSGNFGLFLFLTFKISDEFGADQIREETRAESNSSHKMQAEKDGENFHPR
jgi:hypothetical protein